MVESVDLLSLSRLLFVVRVLGLRFMVIIVCSSSDVARCASRSRCETLSCEKSSCYCCGKIPFEVP